MKKQLLLFVLILLSIICKAEDNATCGFGVTCTYNETKHLLTISKTGDGTGEMYSFTMIENRPWNDFVQDIETIIIENGVLSIGGYAFYGCSNLLSLSISNSVKKIEYDAFFGCSSLITLHIPYSVENIDYSAFNGCGGLESIVVDSDNPVYDSRDNCNALIRSTDNALILGCNHSIIPHSVTSIVEYAFYGCKELLSLTIPSSVTSIGTSAFAYCSNLGSLNVESGNTVYDSRDNCNAIIETNVNKLIAGCKNTNIPDDVTSIGERAFSGCSGLVSISIPNSIQSIGWYAFEGCYGLNAVYISSLEAWCNIDFDNNSFGEQSNPLVYAHRLYLNNEEVKHLSIPETITNIGSYLFNGCSGIESVEIPNSVTSIGRYAFANCTGLKTVSLPNSIQSIGYYSFSGCNGLSSFDMGNSVTFIDGDAFSDCIRLSTISLPKSVQRIGYRAFAGCTSLSQVYCYADNVPSTDNDAFQDTYTEYATLFVPAISLDKYQSASVWGQFKYILPIEGSQGEKCQKPTISYNHGKLVFYSTTEGAQYVSKITCNDVNTFYKEEVELSVTYSITAYAKAYGYYDSDIAIATLCWIDVDPKTEGITTGTSQIPAKAVLIQSDGGLLTIQGADDGTKIGVYNINGTLAGEGISHNGCTTVNTNLQPGSVAIIKIGDRSVKVTVK